MNQREPHLTQAQAARSQSDASYPEHVVTCPFCRSTDTEPLSLFGSQLSTTQHYCRACHTPFEYIKQEPESDR